MTVTLYKECKSTQTQSLNVTLKANVKENMENSC